MKRAILLLAFMLFGVCIGWYFGYTRPVAKQYRIIRDAWHITDYEMAEAGAKIQDNLPQFIEGMKRTDDIATALSLGTIKFLNRGDVRGAKKLLLTPVGAYYRRYHGKGGDPDILARIEEGARQDPDIAAKIVETK